MVYSPYSRPAHAARRAQLTAEVRAEIVARVLDPAYSGRREHSSRVFVDNNGDEHDPDFQLFPAQPVYSLFRRVPSEDDLRDSPYSSSSSTPSPAPNPVALFDDDWDEKEWTREVVVPVPKRKHKPDTRIYVPVSPVHDPVPLDEPYEPRHSAVQLVRADTDADETPSCGYVLRRQWASFALHTRLSAHRIARRARRAVSVGT